MSEETYAAKFLSVITHVADWYDEETITVDQAYTYGRIRELEALIPQMKLLADLTTKITGKSSNSMEHTVKSYEAELAKYVRENGLEKL